MNAYNTLGNLDKLINYGLRPDSVNPNIPASFEHCPLRDNFLLFKASLDTINTLMISILQYFPHILLYK